MDALTVTTDRTRRLRFALLLSVFLLLGWYGLVSTMLPRPLGDENHYQPTICDLVRGDRSSLHVHSITPTWLVACGELAKLSGTSLANLRGIATATGVITLLILAGACWTRDPDTAPGRFACIALHPLLVQMWVLFYSDLPALAAVLLAAWAAHGRRHGWAAAAGLLAVTIRQSNLVWLVMFAVLAGEDAWQRAGGAARPAARRVLVAMLPYGLAVFSALLLVKLGWLRIMPDPYNGPRFNPAQFYLFGLTAAVLWAPEWVPVLWRAWSAEVSPRLARGLFCTGLTALVALLATAFVNPNGGNGDLQWLRNRPLVAMDQQPLICVSAVLLLVFFSATWVATAWHSSQCRRLAIWLVFSLLFLGPHFLVEPRYYITPFVLAEFYAERPAAAWDRLAGWYGCLSIGVVLYMLLYPGGGML